MIGVGRNPDRLKLAVKMGAIDRWSTDAKAAAEADVVILCTPVRRMLLDVSSILPHARRTLLLTDVGSTKEFLVRQIESRIRGTPHLYVGAHPMAGSEKTGVENATDLLFENAAVILTPTPRTPPPGLSLVSALWRALGGKVIRMAPADHDRACALVSHLPHLAATSLVNTLSGGPPRPRTHTRSFGRSDVVYGLCAGGFRDTTRIADADPDIWWEIFDTNAREVLKAADRFSRQMRTIVSAIRLRDEKRVKSSIARGAALRRRIPKIGRGLLRAAFELVVNIPDKPGAIARLVVPLSRRGINIADIEVLHVREGEEGNIRLAFRAAAERAAAVRYLRKAKFTVVLR